MDHPVAVPVFSPNSGVQLPPSVFQFMFQGLTKPLVIKNQLGPWMESRSWNAQDMCSVLGSSGEASTFKVCPMRGTDAYRDHFGSEHQNEVVFETQCEYVEATFTDFSQWLEQPSRENTHSTASNNGVHEPPSKRAKVKHTSEEEDTAQTANNLLCVSPSEHSEVAHPSKLLDQPRTNPLMKYPRDEYWMYADYKYMCQLCKDYPDLLSSVDWSLFGFKGRDGRDSTLWMGSEGAHTPCHYDTYGCNFVAQLSGEKRWVLYSPGDSESLYPTRVPYEESSVFSRVSVVDPDLKTFPKFANATPYTVSVHIHIY